MCELNPPLSDGLGVCEAGMSWIGVRIVQDDERGKTGTSRLLSGKWGDTLDFGWVNPPALKSEMLQAGRKP